MTIFQGTEVPGARLPEAVAPLCVVSWKVL